MLPENPLRRCPQRPAAPNAESCLSALGQLPGLITMGLLTTAQANAIRGTYGTILNHHQRSQSGREPAQLNDADVMQTLRDNPSLLNLLEPLLTDAQIAAVMEAEGDEVDRDGQA